MKQYVRPRHIGRHNTVAGITGYVLMAAIVVYIIASIFFQKFLVEILMSAICLSMAAYIISVHYLYLQSRILKLHDAVSLAQFARDQGYTYQQVADLELTKAFSGMSVKDLHGVRDPEIQSYISGPDWDYAEFSYKIYQKTNKGEYHAATIYYGVITNQLPRNLPNVFFDSRLARGRQFRFHFNRQQRHSLEGDFDKHFETYFPEDYTIDSMSFITPDVMLALCDAAKYDIEINGNRLYLYGPLSVIETQIPDMVTHLQAVKSQLLDNILTYRDERLPYHLGRKHVSFRGAELRRSHFWTYVYIVAFLLYVYFNLYGWSPVNG